ncbi:MAG: hypothetical protein QOJ64_1132 [Acidobacteriota bacterium]|jgi:uncharacterized protein (DUF58 family)|nr:hypothetical protein [Acidobacteriota bacterium]
MPIPRSTEHLLKPSVLAAIGRLDLIARTVVEGFLIGLHKSPYHGLSQEFAEHRPYIAGDEIRRIDWRVYARTDRLYVKESEEETNAPVRILLDVSASLGYAPRDVSKLDYARFLAAALAYLAMRQGDRVGLSCFNERIQAALPARGGERHLQSILVALEQQRASGQTRIGQTALSLASQWKRRGLVILISDLYDESAEIIDAVTRIRRVGHDVIVFHLLDSAERFLEKRGKRSSEKSSGRSVDQREDRLREMSGTFEFHDLETGDTLVADIERVRKAYLGRLEETRATFHREFERAGADYCELDTSEPLDKALATYLRRRRAGKSRGKR